MESEDEAVKEYEIYQLLTKLFLLLDDCDRRFFARFGLSTRQFWALQHLDREQGCSMVELSRVLFTDKSNITGIIDRLEHLHLVSRTNDPSDRRIVLIRLTEEGVHMRDSLTDQHKVLIRSLLHSANSANLSNLFDSLQTMSSAIESYLS